MQGLLDAAHVENSNATLAISALSRLEARVLPMRHGDRELLMAFDDFFARPELIVVPLSGAVIDLATDVRARSRLRTPDALQAASCLALSQPARFITGDAGFCREPALDVVLV
jgi:predicted nucleic acid-binding protein